MYVTISPGIYTSATCSSWLDECLSGLAHRDLDSLSVVAGAQSPHSRYKRYGRDCDGFVTCSRASSWVPS